VVARLGVHSTLCSTWSCPSGGGPPRRAQYFLQCLELSIRPRAMVPRAGVQALGCSPQRPLCGALLKACAAVASSGSSHLAALGVSERPPSAVTRVRGHEHGCQGHCRYACEAHPIDRSHSLMGQSLMCAIAVWGRITNAGVDAVVCVRRDFWGCRPFRNRMCDTRHHVLGRDIRKNRATEEIYFRQPRQRCFCCHCSARVSAPPPGPPLPLPVFQPVGACARQAAAAFRYLPRGAT
jgi:hypothetical protein